MKAQLVRGQKSFGNIDAAVLAGGLGTRIQPVLGDVPKFLAPIDGRTFADYLFDWLASLGVRRVVLCLGHLADRIAGNLEHSPPPFEIVLSVEPEPLGTAGALRHARAHLRSDPVLVLNGDSLVRADYDAFLRQHRESGAMATILCTEVADAGRYGRVALNPDGTILSFAEKNSEETGAGSVNAGVYLMSTAFLDEIAVGSARSLEREIFAAQPQGRLMAYCGTFSFIDIGTPDDFTRATAYGLSAATRSESR